MTRPYQMYRPGKEDPKNFPAAHVSRYFDLKLVSGDMIKIGTDDGDTVNLLKKFIYTKIMPGIIDSPSQIHLTVMNSDGEFRELSDTEYLDKLDLEDNTINVVIQDSLLKDYVSGLYSRYFLKIKYSKEDWDTVFEISRTKSIQNKENMTNEDMMWDFFNAAETCEYWNEKGIWEQQNKQYYIVTIKRLADAGYLPALNYLGHEYFLQDKFTEGIAAYQKASDRGYAQSQTMMGHLFLQGRGVIQDKERAFNLFRQAAEQGDPAAQTELALCYDLGRGVDVDQIEATKWYKLASDQGLPDAQYYLGINYSRGEGGLEKNEQAAIDLFVLAAKNYHTNARKALQRRGYSQYTLE